MHHEKDTSETLIYKGTYSEFRSMLLLSAQASASRSRMPSGRLQALGVKSQGIMEYHDFHFLTLKPSFCKVRASRRAPTLDSSSLRKTKRKRDCLRAQKQ